MREKEPEEGLLGRMFPCRVTGTAERMSGRPRDEKEPWE